ncbi:CD63 antigen-like [Plodia interpunctella]|uniref:CD63 antigen-like n=1 Tax=Plodia interpunctella TaxID=58824 RepID=UPI002367BFBA|nr:CD63 antigen-like [Plodia interpunctella]
MGCGEFLVKYILFFTNLFFALAGLALLGVGIALQLNVTAITNQIDVNLQLGPITTIVVGAIVFLVAFYGCCGAIRESNCMLVTYSISMIVLMITKIALATVIFVNLPQVIDEIKRHITQLFQDKPSAFHEIETAFSCCGPSGPVSYGSPFLTLPDTCCATPPCNEGNAYGGCNARVEAVMHTYGLAIGVVAIVVVSIELVAVVFGLCLANHARNKARRSRY